MIHYTEKEYQEKYLELYRKAGIYLTEQEKEKVAYFGFHSNHPLIGSACVNYFNSERCCARELAMLPYQSIPEHRHPDIGGQDGKEETFRCRYGRVYLYVSGEDMRPLQGRIPEGKEDTYTVFHEIVLEVGEQYTLLPNSLHWFQGGEDGCVVSEFSTHARDSYDIYTDTAVMERRIALGEQSFETEDIG